MFSRKKKEKKVNNEDTVVWCPPNESEVVDQSKMINSLAVFAKIEPPSYNKLEKKAEEIKYNANEKTKFHFITNDNLKKINITHYNEDGKFKEKHDIIIDLDSFGGKMNPLVRKIIIDLEPNLESENNETTQLLLKTEKYIVYGIPLKKSNKSNKEIFKITILILSECKNIVNDVIKLDLEAWPPEYPLYKFYKNPYFSRSFLAFMKNIVSEEIVYEIFEGLDLFDNEIKL